MYVCIYIAQHTSLACISGYCMPVMTCYISTYYMFSMNVSCTHVIYTCAVYVSYLHASICVSRLFYV